MIDELYVKRFQLIPKAGYRDDWRVLTLNRTIQPQLDPAGHAFHNEPDKRILYRHLGEFLVQIGVGTA